MFILACVFWDTRLFQPLHIYEPVFPLYVFLLTTSVSSRTEKYLNRFSPIFYIFVYIDLTEYVY